jgi:histidyl-tRNA synthetase
MGIERLLDLIDTSTLRIGPDAYLVALGEAAAAAAPALAERLRDAVPGLKLLSHCGGGSFKSQFKKADKSGAQLALILGDEEAAAGTVSCKPLRSGGEQRTLTFDETVAALREACTTR